MAGFNFSPIQAPQQQQTSLADLMNVARGAQAFQQAEQINPLQLQQQQAQTELAQTQSKKAKALLNSEIFKGQAEAETAGSQATGARYKVSQEEANKIHSAEISLINHPLVIKAEANPDSLTPKERNDLVNLIDKNAKDQAKMVGIKDPDRVAEILGPYIDTAKNNPGDTRRYLFQQLANGIDAVGKLNAFTQAGINVDSGRQSYTVNQNPIAGPVGAVIPGTFTGKELPPTTPIVSPTGQPGYLGGGGGFVPSALPPNAAVGSEALPKIFADAQAAEGRIAVLQNIKELAKKSFTGVGGQKKEYLSGLAQALHIPVGQLEAESANTDLLAKNTALLALTNGNTDAARALAEAASPHKQMNMGAIDRSANELIAQERMKKKQAEFIAPHINNQLVLQQKLLDFSKVNDFRLLQEMTPQEVAEMKKNMSPSERVEFKKKLDKAKELGVIK